MINLINGECLEEMDKLIEQGVQVDSIICDPPYGTTACKWDSVIEFEAMWERLNRLIKPNGAIVLFGSEPFSSALRMSNIRNYKYDWIWEKNKLTGFLNAKKQPLRKYENIHIFYRRQCLYNPQKTTGHKPVNSFTKNTSDGDTMGKTKQGFKGGGQTDRYPTNILSIPVVNNDSSKEARVHPSQKPILLMEYLVKTYTNENETVLDFTMGSGSTLLACQNLNRNGIGIELDKDYFKIAQERIKNGRDGDGTQSTKK